MSKGTKTEPGQGQREAEPLVTGQSWKRSAGDLTWVPPETDPEIKTSV